MIPVEQSPLEEKARAYARRGSQSGPVFRHILDLLDAARAEIDRLEALTLEQDRRHDLGVRS